MFFDRRSLFGVDSMVFSEMGGRNSSLVLPSSLWLSRRRWNDGHHLGHGPSELRKAGKINTKEGRTSLQTHDVLAVGIVLVKRKSK